MKSPNWMSKEALHILKNGYLLEGENPFDMYRRLAKTAASYYKNKEELEECFYELLENGYLSPATPVAANLGSPKGLPVSCFLMQAINSIDGIYKTAHEMAMLSKNGGGLGVDVSKLIGPSPVTHWSTLYDHVPRAVSQGGTRRGAGAIYCDIDHRDIDKFLHSKEMLLGDPRSKIDCNVSVTITNSFMKRWLSGDKEAIDRFAKVLDLRMKYGSPYILFVDNARDGDPQCYKDNGLETSQSNLCSEIMLHTDDNYSAACVLSSMNLHKFDEWKDLYIEGYHPIELGIYFLDAVNEYFLEKCKKHPFYHKLVNLAPERMKESLTRWFTKDGFERVALGALNGRPLGLGVIGFHGYLLKKGIPFDSQEARVENEKIFHLLKRKSRKASQELAKLKGEPKWCKGYGVRNTHLTAIAPTVTNSVICSGVSPGVEPLRSNIFAAAGAKGNFVRKNPYLEKVLEEKNKNTDDVWKSINDQNGSVQHLSFLTPEEKELFKTAYEIDPESILTLASERQKYIDQGQSINLFIDNEEDQNKIIDWHFNAWRKGMKALYYLKSRSEMKQDKKIKEAQIWTREGCEYCKKSKELLQAHGIDYEEFSKESGKVPEIYLNGKLLDDGFLSLRNLLEYSSSSGLREVESAPACAGCDG